MRSDRVRYKKVVGSILSATGPFSVESSKASSLDGAETKD